MQLIDSIAINYLDKTRYLNLYAGDLADLPEHEAVDFIVVSAFRNNYFPTPRSLIGALHRVGISVKELARDKEVDLRQFSSCWLSKVITKEKIFFKRILCFEHQARGEAHELVGDIFRSLVPFCMESTTTKIAIPLVASGLQGASEEIMLEALVEASLHWLSEGGLPIECIKIVLYKNSDIDFLHSVFKRVKERYEAIQCQNDATYEYDVFISYSHRNKDEVNNLIKALQKCRPDLKVYIDHQALRPGVFWQTHIFEGIKKSRKVICVFSPDYLVSKECVDEFNLALSKQMGTKQNVLFPLYLYTSELPDYMSAIQYEDIREGNTQKIPDAVNRFIEQL